MKVWGIVFVLMLILGGVLYTYYATTQAEIKSLSKSIATLEERNITLVKANTQNLKTIDELKLSYEKIQEEYENAQSDFQKIRLHNADLEQRLLEQRLDILALTEPETVETLVNESSLKTMRCFELLSGAPLTEKEKNAENEQEFNSECPWLFDTYQPN